MACSGLCNTPLWGTWWIAGGMMAAMTLICHFIRHLTFVLSARMFSFLVVVIFIVKFLFSVKFVLFIFVDTVLSLYREREFSFYASKMDPVPGPSHLKENLSLSPPKKRPASHMSVSEKCMVMNCYKHTYNTWPEDKYWTHLICSQKVAEILGISERTVRSILKEHNTEKEFAPPKKPGPKLTVIDKLDEFTYAAIRRTVHQFFHRNEPPTIQKVLQVVNDDPDLPNLSASSLRLVLKHLHFKYASRKRQSCLIDRADIILWRKQYLIKIKQYRREGRPIYYQDETWVNEGHTVSKVWQDTKVLSSRQAFLDGLTTGLKAPSGKGRRLIISHIGSDEGFLEDVLLLFESKKNTDDYHKEMNAQHYEEWLEGILPRLKPNSILVIDNAPYHSRKLEIAPIKKWNKGQIIQWLQDRDIPCDMSMVRAELWDLVEKEKPKFEKKAVDELAAAYNITILRLPPYHCELNAIELVWAQVKGHVAKNNKTFKMADVKLLFSEGLELVTPERWSSCIEHVIKVEDQMCQLDYLIDDVVEPFVINTADDDLSGSELED